MSEQSLISRFFSRVTAERLPLQDEIEQAGAKGEEAIYRLLREEFDCVIRNVVIPRKNGYLEKDFLVLYHGVPVVIEVKSWKGRISAEGDYFCQDRANGTRKTFKSPVGTTNQFLAEMKKFYGLTRDVVGMVVFADPDCDLALPPEMDGVLLVPAPRMASAIRSAARKASKEGEPLAPESVLHCTRLYDGVTEFCKGVLISNKLICYDREKTPVTVDLLQVRYLSIRRQLFRLRDRVTVVFSNGSTAVFYNRTAKLLFHCLDGSYCRIGLNRVHTAVL